MGKYGTTKASRAMESQDREKDLLVDLMVYLADNPMPDAVANLETILMLQKLNRRSR